MAGKLTIRRVGTILPHLCLVVLLVVIGLIIWLSTAGIPSCALRYIEQEAARAGIPVQIHKIQLLPRAGLALKAEDIRLDIPQENAAPALVQLRKAQLVFSLNRLLTGDITPTELKLSNGVIAIPTDENETQTFRLENINIHTDFLSGAKGLRIDGEGMLHGVELHSQVMLRLSDGMQSDSAGQESAQPLPELLGRQLLELRPTLQQIVAQLDSQQWTPESHPVINLKIFSGKKWKYELKADIPSYNLKFFQSRDASIEATFENNLLTVHKLQLRTINPETKVSLQAAYDLSTRELQFNTRSSAPLMQLLSEYGGEQGATIARKIQSDGSTPNIDLSGSANFTEDYALNHITLRGKIEQQELRLGRTQVNHLLLSFYLRNDSFNIDNLQLDLPEGHLKASANATSGSGSAKLDLNLSAETILTLAQDFSGNTSLQLPAELQVKDNLRLWADCSVSTTRFEPGKTRLKDLIPTLRSCRLQFNTGALSWEDATVHSPALTLNLDGIQLQKDSLRIETIHLSGLGTQLQAESQGAQAENLVYALDITNLDTGTNFRHLNISKAEAHLSADSAGMKDSAVQKLHTKAALSEFKLNFDNVKQSLGSREIDIKIHAESLSHQNTSASNIRLDLSIPQGLSLADGWQNMQKDADLIAEIAELRQNGNFCITGAKLQLRDTEADNQRLHFSGMVGDQPISLNTTASLQHGHLLLFNNISANLPLAAMAPLLGGDPLDELKLPRLVTLQGDALINTETKHLVKAHYDIHLQELIRVCRNVHVHKGMEIPLELSLKGEFSTAEDGTMHYDADVLARHQLGELDVHVSGNPLKDCHITGSNTIPVDIVNALIDNTDAHWIMRDFRCRPGITRNNISDINTTVRYDKGIYVHALCKAHLQNMEFMLGALKDKLDAQGRETGEEYLRTDLSPNPYSLIKDGRCDVEVLVQINCEDAEGKPLPERIRINLTNPDLLYDNKPWLKRNGFSKGTLTSRIRGEAVRFNIDNSTISLHKLRGKCYPSYSIGMYYAPIQHYLEDVILKDPVEIATDYCIFPLSRNCKVPMQGLIKAVGATGAGFRFLGTTIPLTNFSGFINISDTDVYLDRMNAQCWGGMMKGALRIGFSGEHTTLDGYIQAHSMNLKDIVASYGTDFSPATCNGFIRFQASEPELDKVVAHGRVSLKDGNLMQLGLFRPIQSLLSDMPGHLSKLQQSVTPPREDQKPTWADKAIRYFFDSGSSAISSVQDSAYSVPFANHFLRYGIDEAYTRFDIKNGHLITRNMVAKGYNLEVSTHLDINLDKMTVQGDLWPRISSVPTVIISPITFLSNFLIDINIYGDLLDPKWKIGLSKKLSNELESLSSKPQDKKQESEN